MDFTDYDKVEEIPQISVVSAMRSDYLSRKWSAPFGAGKKIPLTPEAGGDVLNLAQRDDKAHVS